ncbi:MAG: methylaspartate mutase accessory protein GlmL [Defluviitaleaceae bacterium]|nr:methylaspartate mutase accessory protein GlmL [Defluviitaleaceae bacterium]
MILTVDFGSTFTKLTAVDEKSQKIAGSARAFTTIETDIRDGFNTALSELEAIVGKVEYEEKYAASSAGGGLKMVAVGLVPELTATAARLAANNAGAKVIKTYSYELSDEECDEIHGIVPDIILLCGGTNGGNKDVIIQNAKRIAEIDGDFAVVVAGNKSASSAVMDMLKNRKAILTANVMPSFGKLDIEPAKNAIRELFINQIIEAKGISAAQKMMSYDIIPTPLAAFQAAELLSAELKGLMVVDVGGATTDVYSMADGSPTKPNAMLKGIEEPFAKRSVEGDLGLRYSMPTLIEAATVSKVAKEAGVPPEEVNNWLLRCSKDQGTLANNPKDKNIDDTLAAMAVEIGIMRHCGKVEAVYTPFGETFIQEGKDLSDINYIIGAGGPVIGSLDPAAVLSRAFATAANPFSLMPVKAKLLLDESYIFSAMGLMKKTRSELALNIMMAKLKEVG